MSDQPSFRELLQRVRKTTLSAYSHQDLPFDKLVEELKPERSLSYHPLFQVMFVLQNAPKQTLEFPGLTLTSGDLDNVTSKFDLILSVVDTEQGLKGVWEYNTDLFDVARIKRMSGHFQTLLEEIVANPQQNINELPLLTSVEKQQLLVDWNDTQANYPQKCLHELFEEQVERSPNQVAVVFENQQLTYQELNHHANQLAHHLQTLGVHPETMVGICVERSLQMIVGLLGILKAGGAYVPIAPTYPQERIAYMLKDADVQVLLTQEKLSAQLPEHNAQVVCLDADWKQISQESISNPTSGVQLENLAYVIYTSGSTGKPKGVAIEHRSVINLLQGLEQAIYTVEPNSQLRVSVNGSLAFDTSVKQIIQLLHGHTLDIMPEDIRFDGDALLSYLSHHQIDVFDCTPSQLRLLISSGLLHSDVALKYVLVGGEAIDESTWQVLAQAENIRFYNVYGPTECTVDATISQIHTPALKPVIGRPIANTQIYILDRYLQQVPTGVPGELHIGGVGLARGYLNRPELTQQKFIVNPWSNEPGARLYKTGDLVRYLPDGNIEFLGRTDDQVKVRGFRIELGEIEAILSTHSKIQQTLVMAREDVPGDKRLVAYVVVKPEHMSPTPSELRGFLKEQLPEYMVPAGFIFLDVMPLTPNGKVDRRALPVPDASHFSDVNSFVAPRTPTEEILAAIWTQVLGLEQVGIYDNFFELGGHSLLATQVISRSRQAFGVELPLQLLFETPTIADFAIAIATNQNQGSEKHQAIERLTNQQSLPLSFAQQRLWFLDQLEPNSANYHIPTVVRLQGELNITVLQQSLDAIVAHHQVLRTNFIAENGEPVQVIAEPRSVELKVVDLKDSLQTQQTTVVQQLLQHEVQRPFNLTSDLMLRGCLLVLSPQEHILLLVMHHIASDGWSKAILFEQLTNLYQAFANGLPNPLSELPIQYADYAVWQRQWLTGENLAQQLNYWKQQLAGASPVLEIPTDRPRPALQSYRGAKQSFLIPQNLTKAIQTLSRQENVTVFMTLLAVFQTLLYRYSGQEDILVGSPIAGRNRQEIEGLIGFFVNTLVLRTDMSDQPSFRELLQRVRKTTLSAYSHQDLPFDKLVEELKPERSLSYHPLFQVMFVLQNAPKQTLELPGLSLTPLAVDTEKTEFDLILEIEETEQGLKGIWQYSTDLFDTDTITRINENFQTLLEAILSNPQQKVSELPLLNATQRHQLLVEWNDTQADYPQKCIHQLFEEQVDRTPDAVAVVFEDRQLTYQQLNCRANQLARYLNHLGVKSDTLVGICMERSLEMIVGLMGILKAGGAYVPLDPEYPQERLAYIMEDTQTPVLLTQEKWVNSLPKLATKVVCLDSDWEVIAQHSQDNCVSEVTIDNLLYVIYTSGSTGKPKGVMIPHHGICNTLYWRQAKFELTARDKVLQTISLNFDPSVWQIFWPLSFGGQLIMARPGGHKDPVYLINEVVKQQITILGLVPSIIHALLEEKGFEKCQSLRHVTTGGDALPIELMERFFNCLNLDNVLVNCYGPTEASIDVTTWICQRQTHYSSAPIGRPIANVQIYVLDKNLQPVPIGVPGDLYIGGSGLARGYLNRPDLTQEKFIPNPFSNEPGTRLYKTGDLVRYLPDGMIDFLGRIDHQVKVRGFRIELGEIEATLSTHPAIQQTLVLVRKDVPGDKGLVAYFVTNAEQVSPSPSELRSFLQDKLPDYMVPTAFVSLDAMPLNPNGKVDLRSLPAPDTSHFSVSNNFVAPRTPTEEVLAAIWAEVLNLEQVGIYDNFFELGGHSLLATQVISRSRQAFGLEIPLQLLFETPNIFGLAEAIVELQAENTEDDEISRLLAELDDLSDEEAQNLLAQAMEQ
jgi:surfactin family lipopeptide synthetase A